MKAIETSYKEYKFRSRLEARWAVFLDALGIQWEYEPEGYDLGDAGWYLPDFYLPEMGFWIEIKNRTGASDHDARKIQVFSNHQEIVEFDGPPNNYTNWGNLLGNYGRWGECANCGKILFGHIGPVGRGDGYADDSKPYFFEGYGDCRCVFEADDYLIDSIDNPAHIWSSKKINRAINKAMKARFEHGESP